MGCIRQTDCCHHHHQPSVWVVQDCTGAKSPLQPQRAKPSSANSLTPHQSQHEPELGCNALCLPDADVCHCRVAFQVLPNIVAQPKPIVRWQYAAATVLFGLTLLSATQLGLLANVSKLPKVDLELDSLHVHVCLHRQVGCDAESDSACFGSSCAWSHH